MGKRTRARAQGRHTDRAQRQQVNTNRSDMGDTRLFACPGKAEGRAEARRPPAPLAPPAAQSGRRAHSPPAPPPQPPAPERARRADPPHRGHTALSQVGGKRDRAAPPPQANPTKHGTGAGHAEEHRPRGTALPVPSTGTARCARATPARRGGRGRRGSASAHTHKGHAGNTRRAIGPSPPKSQTAWNGAPASKDKGHPLGTARHTQRGDHGAGRGKWRRHKTRHQPKPPEPAASAAHTQPGHCTRQSSSGAPRGAPAPGLGSLRASPWRSH